MIAEESSQASELDSYHGDVNPGLRTRLGGFVITHQPPLAHEPAEGALHDPAARQDFEAHSGIGAFDDGDRQLGAQSLDPPGEEFTGVAAIHPKDSQPSEPAQDSAQEQLRTSAFRRAGRGHGHAQHQAQGVHQQMPLAPFDALGRVVAHESTMPGGLYALAVQNRRRGPAALTLHSANQRAQHVVEDRPLVGADPLTEDVINRLPRRKVGGQVTPRATTLHQIEDGIQYPSAVSGRASAFGCFGQQGLEVSPLGVREMGVVYGVFHAPTGVALKIELASPNRMSTPHRNIFQSASPPASQSNLCSVPPVPIIQTGSKMLPSLRRQ